MKNCQPSVRNSAARIDHREQHDRLTLVRSLTLASAVVLLSACASFPRSSPKQQFDFGTDSVAYPNELTWEYGYDAAGQWTGHERKPAPDYALHCFVVARDVRQFFYHARFMPDLPRGSTADYLALVRQVLARDPITPSTPSDRIVIPGYRNLRDFSQHWEYLLKAEGGGAWQSYLQRGNWRMVFPFSRSSQAETASELLSELRELRTPIVHVVTFPERTINHAVLVYRASETDGKIQFQIYDPNDAEHDTLLMFERATNTFYFPPTRYFYGGPVDVYEVYRSMFF